MPGTTVYVADHDPAIRESCTALIQSWGLKVRCFATGRELLDALPESPCGCLVLELQLSDMAGLDVWREARARGQSPAVIITACNATVAEVVQAVKAGAIDFLEKPVPPQKLQDGIQRGLAQFMEEWPKAQHREDVRRRAGQLSAEEQTVMQMLLTNRSMQQIADELELSLRTVHLRRARLLQKMRVATRLELAQLLMTIQGPSVDKPPA